MAEHKVEQESKYSILKNISGDLMILMRARMDDAVKPQIVYDGGDHALLYRNEELTVILDFIHPDVRASLAGASNVLIVEAQGGSIIREYYAKMKNIKKVPLPEGMVKSA